ncbi:hypothetical protein NDU88_013045 [Pleurodeles waltl]|uniref:Uncharacterized protein n=1 Tax=Pleurodeles waltl TaxID=8319 RepID=A0AAV7R3L1_PLEWA|nr:hypothetical protein NDU88_013044 [Pleurodeles waltl]KAJ1146785.1 hypothetical protein NDU88_013045 [Pleurodeles waltl]
MGGATGPGDAHGAAGLGEPAREREERGEPGRARGHEAAKWQPPGDLHQQREKCGKPQSSGGEGKEPGVLSGGEALGREVRALERPLFSSLHSPPHPLPPSSGENRRSSPQQCESPRRRATQWARKESGTASGCCNWPGRKVNSKGLNG